MDVFLTFYTRWFEQLQNIVDELKQAPIPPRTRDENHDLITLIENFVSHYAEYYRVKAIAADQNALAIFTAPWASTFELSLQWLAGWRPTTMFHLMYTESCALFESQLMNIINRCSTGGLCDLTLRQLNTMSDLQTQTIKEENAIMDEMAEWQMKCASEILGESIDVDGKLGVLVEIMKMADNLRLKTIRNVVGLLTPQQSVEFIIAASELLFGVHDM